MMASTSPKDRQKARRHAEEYERDAVAYPDERGEILLEAAAQWAIAGDPERALRIYEDLIATDPGEDADYAAVERISLLFDLGRTDEADAALAGLDRARLPSGPAALIAEGLEALGRLEEALTWFNIACRDLLAGDAEEPADLLLFTRPELQGRQRVRRALGLPSDPVDLSVDEGEDRLTDTLDQVASSGRPYAGSFFVRSDIARAFAEGLVHAAPDTDESTYYSDVERGWRASAEEIGAAKFRVLPTTVDDLLRYADEQGRDPGDEQTRADHLRDRLDENAPALDWPPERNAPCWCGSARKYKKCCGSPANR
ncbi:SEC-C domain-containing protein [Actinomadura formosensis]|uniref:SEC-C domain-containing protein n=1 Tax=Actinomadura formosensis TaxID=60706 RepID=UPI000830418D|nr:SEC-C domain-containing protein [Actinomadura formosensis]